MGVKLAWHLQRGLRKNGSVTSLVLAAVAANIPAAFRDQSMTSQTPE
ncbi:MULTISPECIES: hypothetical protein [Bradyrhizobium]|nr:MULTISPECIES: hypothetical protein [Bradyrhizobium]MCA6098959.1 hypothetical protein [Bradyrhizobium australafricanum]MCC8973608.1 hypothetical protein [Bradyrhizobium brasilense]